MATSIIDQLRDLLRDAKQRSLERHRAFAECEDGFAKRLDVLERSWQATHQQLEESHAEQQQALQQDYENALQTINEHHDAEHARLTEEVEAGRANIEELFAADKGIAEAKFKESHWTIQTLNESDKRVARDQILRSHHKLKESRSQLKAIYHKCRRLVRSWKFAQDLSVHINYQPKLAAQDPWKSLEQRRDIAVDCRDRLQDLRLPKLLESRFLLLVSLGAWLVLSVPALFMTWWWVWLLASSAFVPSAANLARYFMTKTARLRVALLWQGLAQSYIDSKPLRQLCLRQARKSYKTQRQLSLKTHRVSLHKITDKFRRKKKALKLRRHRQLARVDEEYHVAIAEIDQQRDQDLQATHETFAASIPELQTRCEQEMQAAEERQRRLMEENDARHVRDWQKLVTTWQEACASLRRHAADGDGHLCPRLSILGNAGRVDRRFDLATARSFAGRPADGHAGGQCAAHSSQRARRSRNCRC